MQVLGEKILAQIADESYDKEEMSSADGQAIDLNALFDKLASRAQNQEQLFSLALEINGGIAEGGTTLSLESNAINLPLRYQNQLKKLLYPDQDYEINLYMIAENNDVSQSKMKIAKVSSLQAYLDDPDSIQAKISTWFDQKLEYIVEAQQAAKAEEKEEAK